MIEVVEDDAAFLSLVEEAEAAAAGGSAKRQKLSSSSSAADDPRPAIEGSYMAALRGSHSSLWQQQLKVNQKKDTSRGGLRTGSNPSALPSSISTGTCFKCGMAGHWARDCDVPCGREWGGEPASVGALAGKEDSDVPEKACPCGSGSCLVLTSNTVKNPGRKFYRCPLKLDYGGCNFFEWCDEPLSSLPSSQNALSHQSELSVPELQCPCGAGSCFVLVTRTGKNAGRQYYCCPLQEGSGSCGYFKWCNDQNFTAGEHAFASKNHGTSQKSSIQLFGERTNSSCFKCGQGHSSRDCPKQLSDSHADIGGKHLGSTASNTCFKCGKSGHWARECPANDLGAASGKGTKAFCTSGAYNCKYSG